MPSADSYERLIRQRRGSGTGRITPNTPIPSGYKPSLRTGAAPPSSSAVQRAAESRQRGESATGLSGQDYNTYLRTIVPAYQRALYGTDQTLPPLPGMTASDGGGGGRRRFGGGGGGGGVSTLTPQQANAALALLNQGPHVTPAPRPLQFTPAEFTPYEPDTSIYDSMLRRITEAGKQDEASARRAYSGLDAQLARYTNPYAGVDPLSTPAVQNAMARMLGAQGSTEVQRGIDEESAYAGNADAAFANVLALLGGAWSQGQQSRQAQAEMDEINALLGIGADVRGLSAGTDASRAKALTDAAFYNNQGLNDTARYNNAGLNTASQANTAGLNANSQANTATREAARQARAQGLLDLLGVLPPEILSQLV